MHLLSITTFPRTDFASLGWQQTAPAAETQAWFPAVHTQTQQFRARRKAILDRVRHLELGQRWEWISSYIDAIPTFTRAAHEQLLQSFRAHSAPRLSITYHVEPFVAPPPGTWSNFDVFESQKWAGILSLTQTFRARAGVRLDVRRAVDPIQHPEQLIQAVTESLQRQWPAIETQLRQFRAREGRKLSLERHLMTWERVDWVITPVTGSLVEFVPALTTQLQQFRSREGLKLDPRTYIDPVPRMDWISQLFQQAALDPELWPAIAQLLHVFRSREGRRFDPRLVPDLEDLEWLAAVLDLTPSLTPRRSRTSKWYRQYLG